MLCCTPGIRRRPQRARRSAAASVTTVTTPKRRSTIAKGCGSSAVRPAHAAPIDDQPVEGHARLRPPPGVRQAPGLERARSAARRCAQPPSATHAPPGRRRGCTQAALTIAAAVTRSKRHAQSACPAAERASATPGRSVDSTAMKTRFPAWHSDITAYSRLRRSAWPAARPSRPDRAAAPPPTAARRSPAGRRSRAVAACHSTIAPLANVSCTRGCVSAVPSARAANVAARAGHRRRSSGPSVAASARRRAGSRVGARQARRAPGRPAGADRDRRWTRVRAPLRVGTPVRVDVGRGRHLAREQEQPDAAEQCRRRRAGAAASPSTATCRGRTRCRPRRARTRRSSHCRGCRVSRASRSRRGAPVSQAERCAPRGRVRGIRPVPACSPARPPRRGWRR